MRNVPAIALALATLLAAPAVLPAQQTQGRYVPLPFDGNVELLVKQRLDVAKELEPYKDLIDQVLRDPKKFNVDPKTIAGFDVQNNPAMQKLAQDWLAKQSATGQPDPEQMRKLQETFKKFLPATEGRAENPQPSTLDPAPDPAPEPDAPKDPLANVTEDLMRRAEESNLGDWLRESPAWQRAAEELQASLRSPDAASRWGLEKWADRFRGLAERLPMALPEGALEPLRRLPTPALPRWDVGVPSLGRWTPSVLTAPGAPTLPRATMNDTVMWLLVVVLLGLTGWWMFRGAGRRTERQAAARALGPWPVAPNDVATRAELVQAFDYLALLTLGPAARTWNHRVVARRWEAIAESARASAPLLADLYEAARYTPGPAALAPAERDEARAALRALAEALPA